MPHLPSSSEQASSILLLDGSSSRAQEPEEVTSAGKWEDEEERRFYEDLADLKDFVPKTFLGIDATIKDDSSTSGAEDGGEPPEVDREAAEADEVKRLEVEMENVKVQAAAEISDVQEEEYEPLVSYLVTIILLTPLRSACLRQFPPLLALHPQRRHR